MMELVNNPDFEDRDGWKRKNANGKDVVYSKRYAMGKVFTMRVRKYCNERILLLIVFIYRCFCEQIRTHPKQARYLLLAIFQTEFDFPLQQAFAEHWENFTDIIHFNKNISDVKVIAELATNSDVVYVRP